MILSDKSIRRLLKEKKLSVRPLRAGAIQPSSMDITLGAGGLILKYQDTKGVLDFSSPLKHQRIRGKELIVPAHSFILAVTAELIQLPRDISAFVEGRSSIGRAGLFIQNASVVGPGFKGKLTLELYNANILPIRLTAGMKIGQLIFFQMDSPCESPYQGKYQGQKTATATKAFLEARRASEPERARQGVQKTERKSRKAQLRPEYL